MVLLQDVTGFLWMRNDEDVVVPPLMNVLIPVHIPDWLPCRQASSFSSPSGVRSGASGRGLYETEHKEHLKLTDVNPSKISVKHLWDLPYAANLLLKRNPPPEMLPELTDSICPLLFCSTCHRCHFKTTLNSGLTQLFPRRSTKLGGVFRWSRAPSKTSPRRSRTASSQWSAQAWRPMGMPVVSS